MMNAVIGSLAVALYLLAGGWLTLRLAHAGDSGVWPRSRPLALAWGAIILHAMVLSRTVFEPVGLNLGFFNALSLTGWLISGVMLAVALVRPVENLGVLVLPFGALTLILGLLFPSQRIVADPSQWPLELHILIAILAYALLALAAVQAVLLAIQDHRLRHRQPGGFLRAIPPLTAMETLLFQMIGIGFVLLTSHPDQRLFLSRRFVRPTPGTQNSPFPDRLVRVWRVAVGPLALRLARPHRHPLDLERLRFSDASRSLVASWFLELILRRY
jgi:ABC-type uncharacterized transport system permease subunit